jgi:hypothetical protein
MKNNILAFLLLFLVVSLSSLPASAFQYSGYKWEDADLPLTYRINTVNRPAWLSIDSFASIVQGGFQAWNDVACSYMAFSYGGATTSTKSRDTTHAIYWNPTGAGMGSALALAWQWTNFNGDRLYDVDMEINGAEAWSITGETNKYDLQSVIAHEAGHYLALDDLYEEADWGKTMYGYLYPGDTRPRTLSPDDQAGICYIYPTNELVFLTVSLPKALIGIAYNQQLQAGGGLPPYTWQVVTGSLPPGLHLNASTGLVGGTPSQTGNFTFTVQITDAASVSLTRIYTIQAASSSQPDIFGLEVGNKKVESGNSTTEGSYTETIEITSIDQTTFPVTTYVSETRRNGVLDSKQWIQKTSNEVRTWGIQTGGDFYKFTSGLLVGWYPANIGDHRYSESPVEIAGLPGYIFSASTTLDSIGLEDVTTPFGVVRAYKLQTSLRIWGYGSDKTETSYSWLIPYIGSVKYQGSTSSSLLQSFVIGGGAITQDTDADDDGLKDWQELVKYNTDPLLSDTDGDGCNDSLEILVGRNPNLADSQGDLNGDCYIDLRDVVLALQILSGITPPGPIHKADVNADGKIGLPEVIYILQKVAGLR